MDDGDIVGRVFGYLTVIGIGQMKGSRHFLVCRCECGTLREFNRWRVASGRTKSCGCKSGALASAKLIGLGHCAAGSKSPTFRSWRSMISRCLYPSQVSYQRYGARGVAVCESWSRSFDAFLADMGVRPEGSTLDRIDVNGNYEPGNCRWATPRQQAQNTRTNTLNPELVLEIVGRFEHGESVSSIARRMNVRRTSAQKVIHGDTWSNITGVYRQSLYTTCPNSCSN